MAQFAEQAGGEFGVGGVGRRGASAGDATRGRRRARRAIVEQTRRRHAFAAAAAAGRRRRRRRRRPVQRTASHRQQEACDARRHIAVGHALARRRLSLHAQLQLSTSALLCRLLIATAAAAAAATAAGQALIAVGVGQRGGAGRAAGGLRLGLAAFAGARLTSTRTADTSLHHRCRATFARRSTTTTGHHTLQPFFLSINSLHMQQHNIARTHSHNACHLHRHSFRHAPHPNVAFLLLVPDVSHQNNIPTVLRWRFFFSIHTTLYY
jgi:hypothetical protein